MTRKSSQFGDLSVTGNFPLGDLMDDLPNFFFVVDVDRKTPSLQVYPQLDLDKV